MDCSVVASNPWTGRIVVGHNPETGWWFLAHTPVCEAWPVPHRPVAADYERWLRVTLPCGACSLAAAALRRPDARREFADRLAAIPCRCGFCCGDRRTDDPAGAGAGPGALSYADARRAYMASGTITDKEAMAACVTLADPDLETLGRDWEPAPVPAARKRWRPPPGRVAAVLALLASVVAIGVAAGWL